MTYIKAFTGYNGHKDRNYQEKEQEMTRSCHIFAVLVPLVTAGLLAACGSAAGISGPSSTAHAPSSPSAETIAARMHVTSAHGYTAFTAATDPNHQLGRAGGYISKVNWDQDTQGEFSSIEVFSTATQAKARWHYLNGFAGQPMLGDGYDYLDRNAVLRVSAADTPAEAQALSISFSHAV